ncbi:MAG: molecular chaperone HtpG [Chitinophagales bacterium]|nr:molecular chaperone HtpG [Chitinophagales bacterium]MCB9031746.1 molecular chaperone HtpG [Chitinophagales bacterium]HAE34272.1 molecular chaperone HtpG [Bacteroidota bacterium]HQU75406.1 molecular chaperone HtpG [Chitinophagales bacterium]
MSEKGTIAVQTENIFPIIKKFLYSDHEIFLRELVSNAVDATQKLKKLSSLGEATGELGDISIEVIVNKKEGTLTISDKGIGMTADEVRRYINQVAFSSAQEFLDKYKGVEDGKTIIGHFGLGFYSAFMVADHVTIRTRSWKNEPAVQWSCDGSPEYTLEETEKESRGTDIILHINGESKEFLRKEKIDELLNKYCRFLPVPVVFGTKEETIEVEGKEKKNKVPNVVNNTHPAWTRKPAELEDEDYRKFYQELYPYSSAPLFWIHLNVDYPFNLTGVLYFPKIKQNYEVQKNKIQLYCNQVFVTDEVKEIVPEWLTLLHGVIDSPDIPLNVSRSYLQSDSNVKKINNYITKKVAERLEKMFTKEREEFEKQWENISVIVKYGMLTDEKFYDKASKFVLLQNTDGKYFTVEEYKEHIRELQTDKHDALTVLYSQNPEEHHVYIDAAKARGYDVIQVDTIIDNHFISFLEGKLEKVQFKRVDADTADKLIDKDETTESVLTEEESKQVQELFEQAADQQAATVVLTPLSPEDNPVAITRPEFMRRMKEMSGYNGMDFAASMPDQYNLVVNTNHPLIGALLKKEEAAQKEAVRQLQDLALLSQGMLKGADLSAFVKRSFGLIGDQG